MHYVEFISWPLRDKVAALLWDAYCRDVIPAPIVYTSSRIRVEADRLQCEAAIRRVRAKYSKDEVEIYASW